MPTGSLSGGGAGTGTGTGTGTGSGGRNSTSRNAAPRHIRLGSALSNACGLISTSNRRRLAI